MRFASSLAVAVLALTPALAQAQIPITSANASVDPATRVLVSNAVADKGIPAAEAIKVSNAVRTAFARIFAGKKTVIQKEILSMALKRFGFEADASLDPASLGALAEQLKAGYVVALTVKPGSDGNLVAVASVNGKGSVTADAPNAGALGEALADMLKTGM